MTTVGLIGTGVIGTGWAVTHRHSRRIETLSDEIGALFNPNDPANRIYPPQRLVDEVLALLNNEELQGLASKDAITKAIAEIDANGDGEIDFEEFKLMMAKCNI